MSSAKEDVAELDTEHVATSCFALRTSTCATCTAHAQRPGSNDRHRLVAEWSARFYQHAAMRMHGQKVYATHCARLSSPAR